MASSEDRAAAIARVHSSARKASAWLLRIGTAPFAAHTLLLATDLLPVHLLSESMRPPLEIALVCHAGTIIAFIGGLQQAVAVGEGGAQLGRHSDARRPSMKSPESDGPFFEFEFCAARL